MTQKKSPSLLDAFLGQAGVDRLQAAKLYFSGELAASRAKALEEGDLPWRILRYERILDPEKLGYPISKLSYVRPDSFEKQLKYLAKHCRVVSLDALAASIWQKAEIPDHTVAVTVDGGWIDNFVYAFPLLLKYRIPTTFFLPTAFIDTHNFFWQDKVLFVMQMMKQRGLSFTPFSFFTPDQIEAVRRESPDGEITLPLIFVVIAALSAHNLDNRALAISALAHVAQQLGGNFPAEPAFMSWNDVRIMNNSPVSFGSLGHTHCPFDELSSEQVISEIEQSWTALRMHTNTIAAGVSLPGGRVSAETLRALGERDVPYVLAHSDGPDPKMQSQRPLILGRLPVSEGETFATELFACLLWLRSEPAANG